MIKSMEQNIELSRLKDMVEQVLKTYMPKPEGEATPVITAMNYAVEAGGKRIRPLLLFLTYRAFGGTEAICEPFMAAMEMIHTYSLIHDDLPALDNDDLRRGRPTVHVKFGEDIAILAGDGLLNYAYETAAKAFAMSPGNRNVERAYTVLAGKPGIYGMIGGQTADVVLTGKPLTKEQLVYIYENKTSALLECAMTIGGILAGASDDEVEKLRISAHDMGMAFQVQDDILDLTGDEAVLGKPIGSDEKNEKYTYATMFGIDEAVKYVQNATERSIQALRDVAGTNENIHKAYMEALMELIRSLAVREK